MRKAGFFDIYVDEMQRAQKFYEDVLQTKLQAIEDPNDSSVEMRAFADDFQSHGAGGALVKIGSAKSGPGGTMIYFTCEDCAIEAAGGKLIRPKFSIGEHGFVALATDTEGNPIGFHSLK